MLLACGSNGRGQLGLGDEIDMPYFEAVDIELSGPIRISGGGNHTLIVNNGKVFASGSNEFGQLGIEGPDRSKFVEVPHPKADGFIHWTLAAAGWGFSVFVDSKQQVWTVGHGFRQELGMEVSVSEKRQLTPLVRLNEIIVDVKAGMSHVVLLTESGRIWGWGGCRNRQLGPSGHGSRSIGLTELECPPVSQISCGRSFTLLLLESKEVVTWGDLEVSFGEGHGDGFSVERPCKDIHAGWTSALLHGSDGEIQLYGNNGHGQLDHPKVPLQVVAAGSEHYLGYDGRRVLSWGWGEHGNTPKPYEVSAEPMLFGGCATSFIYIL